jgi:hypothetical protein
MASNTHSRRVSIWFAASGAVLCLILGPAKMAWSEPCSPGPNEVALYTEPAFRGFCVVKDIGEHPVIHLPGQDERSRELPSFASIILGGRVEVLACSEPKLTGTCIVVSKSLKTFANQKIRSAMSVVVRDANRPPVCAPEATKVAIWDYQHFFGDCQVFNPGAYPYSIRPLLTGSIQVGAEARAKLCSGSAFESPCRDFGPGSYATWSYEDGGRRVRGIDVYPLEGRCHRGNRRVTLYEYANFAGRCHYFDELREYSAEETWGWADHNLHSVDVGDDQGVSYTLCMENDQGRKECWSPSWRDIAEGVPDYDLDHPPRLTLARRQEPHDQPQDEHAEAEEEHSRTVWLAGHAPFDGPLWWDARFPSIGSSDATLTRVANPRNSVWLGFLKPGHGSDDCNNADAYVRLEAGTTMTADQMAEAFGAENPELPITFVACSGASADAGAGGQLVVPALPLNISYTEPR